MIDPSFSGWFDLATPEDLLEKLRHDLARVEADPLDPRPAFDFVVTAYHLLEWTLAVIPEEVRPTSGDIKKGEPFLALLDHLASGAKHFEATYRHHQSVESAARKGPAYSSGFGPGFHSTPQLRVQLSSGEYPNLLGEPSIQVRTLARVAVRYWERRLPEVREGGEWPADAVDLRELFASSV